MQSGVQCKAEFNKEIRRFIFNGVEFASLHEQITNLFGIQKDFVVKYKDDEGDMVVLSSTEELSFALASLVPTQALRLEITMKAQQQTSEGDNKQEAAKGPSAWKWQGGMWGNKMTKKQQMENYLERLQSIPENDWNREWKIKKIKHLQSKLAALDGSSAEGCQTNDCQDQGCGQAIKDCQTGFMSMMMNKGCGQTNDGQDKACGPSFMTMMMNKGCGQTNDCQDKACGPSFPSMGKGCGQTNDSQDKACGPSKSDCQSGFSMQGFMPMQGAMMGHGFMSMKGGCKNESMSAEEKGKFDSARAERKAAKEEMCKLGAQLHQKKYEYHMAPKENKDAVSKEIESLKNQMKQQKQKICAMREQKKCH